MSNPSVTHNLKIETAARFRAIAQVLRDDSLANGGTPPATAQEFVAGLNAIGDWLESQPSTVERALRAVDLGETLVCDFPAFPGELQAAYTADSPTGQQAERLVRTSMVTDATTFADLPAILDEDRAA